MFLAIDAGNTNIKWALHDGTQWHSSDQVRVGGSLHRLSQVVDQAQQICISNVSGANTRLAIEQVLAGRPCTWLVARKDGPRLTNDYRPPESLGTDRWCALLAVRARYECAVVVLVGTAVTIDAVAEDGVYRGGLIIPGLHAMQDAVVNTTRILRTEQWPGRDCVLPEPNNTGAALTAGALYAIAGAIKLFIHNNDWDEAQLVLASGDAELFKPMLPNCVVIPELIYEGMRIAQGN